MIIDSKGNPVFYKTRPTPGCERDVLSFREHFATCPKCHSAKQLSEICGVGVDLTLNRLASHPSPGIRQEREQ